MFCGPRLPGEDEYACVRVWVGGWVWNGELKLCKPGQSVGCFRCSAQTDDQQVRFGREAGRPWGTANSSHLSRRVKVPSYRRRTLVWCHGTDTMVFDHPVGQVPRSSRLFCPSSRPSMRGVVHGFLWTPATPGTSCAALHGRQRLCCCAASQMQDPSLKRRVQSHRACARSDEAAPLPSAVA